MAVCQPCVAVLVAIATMAQDNHPAQPRSMTLMAGPIDTRVNPTRVNELANSKPIDWFEQNLIARVPFRYRRRLSAGLSRLRAACGLHEHEHRAPRKARELYELLSEAKSRRPRSQGFTTSISRCWTCRAEFYLETVRLVFQEYALPPAKLKWRGQPVDPRTIKRTALLTVEGEKDDISALGHTAAARTCARACANTQASLYPGGGRPLRRILRQALEEQYLPAGEKNW